MKPLSKKTHYKREITHYLNSLDIAWYLREEVERSFEHMNFYKAINLRQFKEAFAEHLETIDSENNRLMKELFVSLNQWPTKSETDTQTQSKKEISIDYYISQRWRSLIPGNISSLLSQRDNDIEWQKWQIIHTLKAMLVFTITEYLHASSLRICIQTPVSTIVSSSLT